MNVKVDANPERRLFVSLLTRDISLSAAFLDLIDNSINSILEAYADNLKCAADYMAFLEETPGGKVAEIDIKISSDSISVTDSASGISIDDAKNHVFHFGRPSNENESRDRLSVYGIGLKRALFKMAGKFCIASQTQTEAWSMEVDVDKWEADPSKDWSFQLSENPLEESAGTGTIIHLTDLHEDVKMKVNDGVFMGQLKSQISKTYLLYLGKIVVIRVNGKEVAPVDLSIGENLSFDEFSVGRVSCAISAGLRVLGEGDTFNSESAGWFVFCNGRVVLYAEKSSLTGWIGGKGGLPLFQPKHRPFVGVVFFVSSDPEKLPWTTTKASIDQENIAWQKAYKKMLIVGKEVTRFLDLRYSSSQPSFDRDELSEVAKDPIPAVASAVRKGSRFATEKPSKPKTTRIQFDAREDDLNAIRKQLRKRTMSAKDIGLFTFNYYLRNKVRNDD